MKELKPCRIFYDDEFIEGEEGEDIGGYVQFLSQDTKEIIRLDNIPMNIISDRIMRGRDGEVNLFRTKDNYFNDIHFQQ